MRNAVSAFGTFQGLVSGSAIGPTGCFSDGSGGIPVDPRPLRLAAHDPSTISAIRSTPIGVGDDGIDQVTDEARDPGAAAAGPLPSTSGP